MRLSAVLCVAAVLLLAVPSHALFFRVREGQKRCFINDVPRDTLVQGDFNVVPREGALNDDVNQDGWTDQARKAGGQQVPTVKVTVTQPDGKRLVDADYPLEARFAFNTPLPGEYITCLGINKRGGWFRPRADFDMHLAIDTGADATNFEELAEDQHLDEVELSLRRVLERVRGVQQEQAYQKKRERDFRDLSESTCEWSAWFSVVQMVVLVGTAYAQVTYLKSYFKTKKLV